MERLDYCFSENGVHAFHGTKEIHCKSIVEHLGNERWAEFEAGIKSILDAERDVTSKLLQLASPGMPRPPPDWPAANVPLLSCCV